LDFQGIGLDVESNPIGNIIEAEGSEIYFQDNKEHKLTLTMGDTQCNSTNRNSLGIMSIAFIVMKRRLHSLKVIKNGVNRYSRVKDIGMSLPRSHFVSDFDVNRVRKDCRKKVLRSFRFLV
jgi:hypothetical protein